MAPDAAPFSISQKIGLPEPYKAPAAVVEVSAPAIVATTVEPPVEAKKSVKAARKHKLTRFVRQAFPQGRYAAYPSREYESTW